MRRTATIVLAFFAAAILASIGFTYRQVSQERVQLENNLEYRSSLLADGLREAIEPNFANQSDTYLQNLVERYSNRQRIAGLAVVDNKGKPVAMSSSLTKESPESHTVAANAMDADAPDGAFVENKGVEFYTYAVPLHETNNNKTVVVGALLIVQKASYINDQLNGIWRGSLIRLFLQAFVFVLAALLILRWVIISPIQRLAANLRLARLGKNSPATQPLFAGHSLFKPIASEVSRLQQSLAQARKAATERTKPSLEKIDTPWTESRLQDFTKDILKDRTIVAVSNLEPYVHKKQGHDTTYHVPASGLITAIEPVMQATGGIWVAQGSGEADKLVVDDKDSIMVPPENPRYKLRRVWLTKEEEDGYYYGFSDQALYPLCHMAHVRPTFRSGDWKQYEKVNKKFAQIILAEIKSLERPVIFIQDFQFTLLPRLIKKSRPDATVGLFWHIPWVNAEVFSICPWRKEILDGMLGADLLGFHTQLHCNNFIDTVSRELESLIDYESFTVTRNQHVSLVRPFPISITFTGDEEPLTKEDVEATRERLLKPLGVKSQFIGLGVDRLDYIKGVAERFTAVEILLERNPSLRGKVTLIQISAPPETKSEHFIKFEHDIDAQVERVNSKYRTKNWQPIVFLKRHHSHAEVAEYYKIANFCLVSSLHDGMNLVAKEYVAARSDDMGVLVLSQFAGASKELGDALIVNPYDAVQTAKAIRTAVNMPKREQVKRMKRLRTVVKNYNIYRWSAEFIKTIASME